MGWFPQQAGGLNRMYYHLVHSLPGAGVKVRGLVAGRPIPRNGVTVDAFATSGTTLPGRLLHARTAARRALADDVDLVVSHFALYTFPWIDLMDDRPFVMHFHGPWALEGTVEKGPSPVVWTKKRIEQVVYRRANRFIVLSKAFRDVLHDTYDVPLDRIDIVPGGVNVDQFDIDASPEAARRRLNWPTNRPVVFCVRRLAHRMGLENLIDAMAEVRRQVPDALLLIAGKGPLRDALHARIGNSGLEDAVRLLGFVPDADLPYAYRAADFSIVPTIALEGFGLITIESLAAGTPVLVTPIGGLPETVRNLDPNLILPSAEPAVLAETLIDRLKHPASLPSADACTRYARETFDWPIIAARTRDVYARVLNTHD